MCTLYDVQYEQKVLIKRNEIKCLLIKIRTVTFSIPSHEFFLSHPDIFQIRDLNHSVKYHVVHRYVVILHKVTV